MAMNSAEFRAALDRLELTQEGGADIFLGTSPRTVRRWAADEAVIPDSVEMLLRLMVAQRLKPRNVRLRYCKGPYRARDANG